MASVTGLGAAKQAEQKLGAAMAGVAPAVVMTREVALRKFCTLKEDFPHYEMDMAAFNRFGVGVFGIDKVGYGGYVFCWADPEDVSVRRIKNADCDRPRGFGITFARCQKPAILFTSDFRRKPDFSSLDKADILLASIQKDPSKPNFSFLTASKEQPGSEFMRTYKIRGEAATEIDLRSISEEEMKALRQARRTEEEADTKASGLEVDNRTQRQIRVTLLKDRTRKAKRNVFEIRIDQKMLITPISSYASGPDAFEFILGGSKKLTFEDEQGLVRITEVDGKGTNLFYVNTSRAVDGIAYDVLFHLPREMDQKEFQGRVDQSGIRADTIEVAAFNKHGGVLIVKDPATQKKVFYYCGPEQDAKFVVKPTLIFEDRVSIFLNDEFIHVKTSDGSVNFRMSKKGKGAGLNGDAVTIVKLTS